jgi:hypothetical protein
MEIKAFEKTISIITDENINLYLLENQESKKWYEKKYTKVNKLAFNTIYGVCIDNVICFEFRTSKNIDGLLKTFISQYCAKRKEYKLINGEVRQLSKKELFEQLKINNTERVHKGLFYTTLYGVGLWDFFNSKNTHEILNESMSNYLKSKGLQFKNEYSDAGWVFRYKFNMPIQQINELLESFTTVNH